MIPITTRPFWMAILFVLLTSPASSQEDSPMAALEAQSAAILEAETLDEVSQFLPEHVRNRIAAMTEEQKAAGLEEWKGDVRIIRPIRELVDGDRGAILVEGERRVRVLLMTRTDDQWTVSGEDNLGTATPRGRGGFVASGAAERELEQAVVEQTWIEGAPVLTMSDQLEAALHGTEVSSVILVLPDCPEPGSYSLSARETEGAVSSRYSHATSGGTVQFGDDVTGTLQVDEAEGGRFSGTFELRAHSEEGDSVTITGWLEDALTDCEQ